MYILITMLLTIGTVFGDVSENGDPTTNPDGNPTIIIFDDRQQ